MGNDSTAIKIRAIDDPILQKRLGRYVKGKEDIWMTHAKDVMLPAIRAKFEQNPALQKYLISTGDKILGEASQDRFWGIGYSLGKPEVLDHHIWQGKNILGEMLMTVREELKSH